MWILEPIGARDDYQIQRGPGGKREILTDYAGPLEIEWIEDVVEPASWSVEFEECFAMRLAWHVADRLSGDDPDMVAGLRRDHGVGP